jgi:hypothetical protein
MKTTDYTKEVRASIVNLVHTHIVAETTLSIIHVQRPWLTIQEDPRYWSLEVHVKDDGNGHGSVLARGRFNDGPTLDDWQILGV